MSASRSPSRRTRKSKPRDAEASRAAILAAARACFGESSFDQVGVRAIAARAGVDAALVVRYFGSKEALFRAALSAEFDTAALTDPSAARFLAEYALRGPPKAGEFDALVAMLRSASSPPAAEELRSLIDEKFVAPLAGTLAGSDARVRAALVAATILGVKLMRDIVDDEALRPGATPRVVSALERGLAALLAADGKTARAAK